MKKEDGFDIVEGLDEAEYHGRPETSNSDLIAFDQSPAHFILKKNGEQEDATEQMDTGTMIHCAILEPDKFNKVYIPGIDVDKKSKSYQLMLNIINVPNVDIPITHELFGLCKKVMMKRKIPDQIAILTENIDISPDAAGGCLLDNIPKDKKIVTQNEIEMIEQIKENIDRHPYASQYINHEGASKELSIFWKDITTKTKCKGRIDFNRTDKIIVDLKSTKNASPLEFNKSIFNYKYFMQAAFYLDGISAITGERYHSFYIIAIETKKPYLINCFSIDITSEWYNLGGIEYLRILRDLKKWRQAYAIDPECPEAWTGYKFGENGVHCTKPTKWMEIQIDVFEERKT